MDLTNKAAIKKIIILSLQELILNDTEIFSVEPTIIEFTNVQSGKIGNRLVHETAINHRFALYLEQNLSKYICDSNYYHVDIEYNRYFGKPKELNGDNIRPDILIHKRQGAIPSTDNLLIIEAKKNLISKEDSERVQSMMKEKNYLFQFGLTVVYCNNNDTEILCELFFKNNGKISCDTFKINKTSP
jgi:hypothetical protein